MHITGRGIAMGWVCVAMLALSGCRDAAEETDAARPIDRGSPVDPASFAGDVRFRVPQTLPAGDGRVPIAVYLGIAAGAGTRLEANALVDLRDLQAALPELLSGAIEPSCGLGLDIDFADARAEGDVIRARAAADARIYRCRDRGTDAERRGGRLLTRTIDIEARVSGRLEGQCVAFSLVDLDLNPRGILGAAATLFGVTARARDAILERTRAILAETPVCPDLPEALALLEPRFSAFGPREIGEGGVGAALSGSVDLDAGALVELLALVAARGTEADDGTGPRTPAAPATLRIDDTIAIRGQDVAYGVDLGLAAAGPTRIDVEAAVDLRELQSRLSELLAGEILVDICGGRIDLRRLEAEASGRRVIVRGRAGVETFDCERTGPGSWERGALLDTEVVGARAELSTEIAENCVVFRLLDLSLDPPGGFERLDTGSGRPEAVRELLLEAAGLVLEEVPFCPEPPPQIAVLDPRFDRVSPEEIGDGGVGIGIDGSIDVSPRTVIGLLEALQARGIVPTPP